MNKVALSSANKNGLLCGEALKGRIFFGCDKMAQSEKDGIKFEKKEKCNGHSLCAFHHFYLLCCHFINFSDIVKKIYYKKLICFGLVFGAWKQMWRGGTLFLTIIQALNWYRIIAGIWRRFVFFAEAAKHDSPETRQPRSKY